MKKLMLILFSASFLFAQESLDEFEQSLIENTESASSSSSSENVDSAGEIADSADAFEKSLAEATPSDMFAVYRLREQLLEAAKQNDSSAVIRVFDEMDARSSSEVVPVVNLEKKIILLDCKMYRDLLAFLVKSYQTAYDTKNVNANVQIPHDDVLMAHIKSRISTFDTTQTLYHVYAADIEKSDLNEMEREELELLLLLEDAYVRNDVSEQVRERSSQFVEKYPDHPDSRWIKKCVLSPLQKMDVWELRAEQKERVIQDKLYTGGFGFNLYLLHGGTALGMDPYYREDLYEPDESVTINFELYMQIAALSVSFEMIRPGLSGVTTTEFGVGYVVYDSRYLKVRPYFAFGESFMDVISAAVFYKKNEQEDISNKFSTVDSGVDFAGEAGDGTSFTFGLDVDFKFATCYFLLSDTKLASFVLASKFGLSYVDLDDGYGKGKGVTLFFNLGLGVYMW